MSRLAFATLVLAACAGRQTAATQATPAAFDAAKSDPKALAIADQVLTALGGEANWNKAKEISWSQGIVIDGKLADFSRHSWDRWNGRHRYERMSPNGTYGVTMHDLFDETSYALTTTAKGGTEKVSTADKPNMVAEAKRRFATDVYPFVVQYKLKDPGVHLKVAEERPADGAPASSPMKYDVLELSFDPGVGPASSDTWYVVVDKTSHLPTSVEHHIGGKPENERSGFTLEDWVDVGGLKFAGKRVTIGYGKADAPKVPLNIPPEWAEEVPYKGVTVPNPGELLLVTDVKVGEPTDDLYVPQVQ